MYLTHYPGYPKTEWEIRSKNPINDDGAPYDLGYEAEGYSLEDERRYTGVLFLSYGDFDGVEGIEEVAGKQKHYTLKIQEIA